MAYVLYYQRCNCTTGWRDIDGWPTNELVSEGLSRSWSDRCGSYPYNNSKGFRCVLQVSSGETVFVTTSQTGSNNVAPLTNQRYTEGTYVVDVWFSPDGALGSGTVTFSLQGECSDDSDCEEGEKCVDGECVPCDEVVDGKGVVTLWAVKPIDGSILTDGLDVDISSGVASVKTDLLALTSGRIQIFNGMSGTLTIKAGIGILGSDFGATVTLFSGAVSSHYQDFIFDSGNLPFGYGFNGKVVFEILNYDTLGDCADDDVDDTPEDSPIDIVDGGEPLPPGGDEPEEIDEPLPPAPETPLPPQPQPPTPETGCECEIYQAQMILSGLQEVRNAIINHQNQVDARLAEQNSLIHSFFSDHNRILFEQLSESNRLSYELSLFLSKKFYPQLISAVSSLQSLRDDIRLMRIELESIHDEVLSIDKTLEKGLILPECGSEPEKGLVDVFDEFVQKYEPVDVVVEESDVWQHSPDEAPRNYPRKL